MTNYDNLLLAGSKHCSFVSAAIAASLRVETRVGISTRKQKVPA